MTAKYLKSAFRNGTEAVLRALFVLFSAPVIHLSGLDEIDRGPDPEEIKKSQQLADKMKMERNYERRS